MDLAQKSEVLHPAEDHTWLGKSHGFDEMDPITLDKALFSLVTFPDGVIPSGVALGKVTATGKYGPYGKRSNEVQTVTVDATGGTYTLTFDGETTGAIAFDATAATVRTALEALSNINPGDVVVTGGVGASGGGTPYTITFTGQYAGTNVPQLTSTNSVTGGGDAITHATTTQGGSAVSDGREVCAGHLGTTQKFDAASGSNISAPLYWHGEVVESKLPTAHGLDAAGKSDCKHIKYV